MTEEISYDELYNAPIYKFTKEEKEQALDVFSNDTMMMMEELEGFTNAVFDIKDSNISESQLRHHRAFNSALSDLINRAHKIHEITKKQNER